jgi:hypothetical protein
MHPHSASARMRTLSLSASHAGRGLTWAPMPQVLDHLGLDKKPLDWSILSLL